VLSLYPVFYSHSVYTSDALILTIDDEINLHIDLTCN